jgi:lipoprotein NlpD
MRVSFSGRFMALAVLAASLGLAACSSKPQRAPVEDRRPTTSPAAPAPTATPPSSAAAGGAPAEPLPSRPAPGADSAGKPGFYTVRPGDTLLRIGLEHGQNWRDLARWNELENPNLIEVGQVLRVVPPGADAAVAVARPVAPAGRVETRPIESRPPVPAGVAAAAASPAAAGASAAPPSTAAPPAAPRDGDEDISWLWPASGPVLVNFDEGRSIKGVAIGGKAGDPVLAAADGRVIYAGAAIRGYGNLLIVKHNNTYLTAYAHNQTLLVREDQVVRRGQKIAEMGSSDADRVQLHFEIRRQGRPVDPLRLLPPR